MVLRRHLTQSEDTRRRLWLRTRRRRRRAALGARIPQEHSHLFVRPCRRSINQSIDNSLTQSIKQASSQTNNQTNLRLMSGSIDEPTHGQMNDFNRSKYSSNYRCSKSSSQFIAAMCMGVMIRYFLMKGSIPERVRLCLPINSVSWPQNYRRLTRTASASTPAIPSAIPSTTRLTAYLRVISRRAAPRTCTVPILTSKLWTMTPEMRTVSCFLNANAQGECEKLRVRNIKNCP